MLLKNTLLSSLDFVKNRNDSYFQLLRLARVSHEYTEQVADLNQVVNLLNQVPLFVKEHKRIIPLLNNKAHQLNVFKELSEPSQYILTTLTQQGVVTELAKKAQINIIVDRLSSHDIPVILLKGAAFSEVLYSKQAPRTSNDLDILIQKKHWHNAINIIKILMDYTPKARPDVFGDLFEQSFIPKTKVGSALDLHSSLANPLLFNIHEEQLWNGSVEHPLFNSKYVRTLSPEHALIHQAIHAYKDMNFSKYNLVDSHEIISAQLPDIKKAIVIAKEWGVKIPLFILLTNCTEIMDSKFDRNLLNLIQPNFFILYCIKKLLKSRFNQPRNNKKTLRYRMNQLISQFVFTGSIRRPLALQCLFVKTLLFPSYLSKR